MTPFPSGCVFLHCACILLLYTHIFVYFYIYTHTYTHNLNQGLKDLKILHYKQGFYFNIFILSYLRTLITFLCCPNITQLKCDKTWSFLSKDFQTVFHFEEFYLAGSIPGQGTKVSHAMYCTHTHTKLILIETVLSVFYCSAPYNKKTNITWTLFLPTC